MTRGGPWSASTRRSSDWRGLLEIRCRDAERVVLVMDQLNTHSLASRYEAFAPEEAKRLAGRVELHHTPKHGSWLNIAEVEFRALGRQCLARRIASHDMLCRHVAQWEEQRNATQATVRWHLTTDQARVKLRSLYPLIES